MAFQSFVDIGNGLSAVSQPGDIRIRRNLTGLEISVDGAPFTSILNSGVGLFGEDTIVQKVNSTGVTLKTILEIVSAYLVNTPGNESSTIAIKVAGGTAAAGLPVAALTLIPQGVALPDGVAALPSLTFASEPGANTGWFYAGDGIWAFSSNAGLLGRIGPIGTGWTFFDRVQESRGADIAVAAGVLTTGNANFFQLTSAGAVDFITTTTWNDGARIELLCTVGCTFSHATGGVPANTQALNMISGANTVKAAGGVIAFRRNLASNRWQQVA